MLFIAGVGDCYHTALLVPAEDNLGDGLVMLFGNLHQNRVWKHLGGISPSSKWIPSLHGNTILLYVSDYSGILVIRMNLILNQIGLQRYLWKKVVKFPNIIA